MRRIWILLLTVLMLWGCTARQPEPANITVSLALPEGCSVTENGLQIQSGQDAVFELILNEGYEFASLDYEGAYTVESKNGLLYLRLESVRYATLAPVTLTNHYCTILYEPNGGEGEPQTVGYDTEEHIRPNTSIGTDIFSREEYTLTGWNTEPDGSGTAVGLGSRVTVPDGELTLYAQWAKWSSADDFTWILEEDGVKITSYTGSDDPVVVPGTILGNEVTVIGIGAFNGCMAEQVILPPTVKTLQMDSFTNCALRELTFFDNIEALGDISFSSCPNFSTVHINAVEAPWGYNYRRESCLADKVDMLIAAQGQQKLVFYGGCSMWYNLDGQLAQEAVGDSYRVINMGLNGVMNSYAQVQILSAFLEPGDVFFHTPEVSSDAQMMNRVEMINHDRKLWCGMEYNYDLVSLLDIRTLPEFFDILYYWLSTKEQTSSYTDVYRDSQGNRYVDEYGCVSFPRTTSKAELSDKVNLQATIFNETAMDRMEAMYQVMVDRDVAVYVGYACVNQDAVTEEQTPVETMDELFRQTFNAMEGVTVVGSMLDHVYHNSDFYDTNYHLLTDRAWENTVLWMRDLTQQMILDGLLPDSAE